MCAPSTSASVRMTILLYLSADSSNSSPFKPSPSAVTMAVISVFLYMLASSLRSTLRILPRSGSTAWKRLSRPCLALPPAESPSTRKISVLSGSLLLQSESLPGRDPLRSTLLRRTSSLARFAASAAFCAWLALLKMLPSVLG